MDRNSVEASNGRVRYVGRDFDLYFLTKEDLGDNEHVIASKENILKYCDYNNEKANTAWFYKMVASTNCSFNSTATYDTIIDKSTPKSGIKQLNSIDWSFSSDNNIANLEDIQALMEAHKAGTEVFCVLSISTPDDTFISLTDENGSVASSCIGIDCYPLFGGICQVQSITLNAQDGSLATFSMSLEGSGDYLTSEAEISDFLDKWVPYTPPQA